MKRKQKIFILLSIFSAVSIVLVGFFWFETGPLEVQAGASQNVSGFAWSENIGWVCLNNTSGGGGTNYGVNIESNKKFSGYAWSESIGWIDFSPSPPYPASPNTSVKVDKATGEVSGWARVLSYGGSWDGWLKMYNVSVDLCTGKFSGFAWGSDVLGWVSFSGADYQTQTTFALNTKPVAGGLYVDQGDYCVLAFQPRFYWTFSDEDGDSQNAYRVQIDDDADIGTEPILDSCSPWPGTCSDGHTAESYTPASPSAFTYNKTYYWRVKVWDNRCNGESEWVSSSFATPQHKYPEPVFTWTPSRPSKGEFAQFCATQEPGVCESDISKCYNVSGQQISCNSAQFLWTFPSGTEFSTTTSEVSKNPKVKFPEAGWRKIYLNINNGVGSCTSSVDMRISSPLPKWKEVAP